MVWLGGQIKAIALTAYAGENDQQQLLAGGFQQHLTKPIAPDDLVAPAMLDTHLVIFYAAASPVTSSAFVHQAN